MIHRPIVLALLLALATALAPAWADTGDPAVALGWVRLVEGFHPVRDLDDGLLFGRYFDGDCQPIDAELSDAETSDGAALAGTVGGEVVLQVDVLGCRRSKPPRTRCQWRIEPVDDPICPAADDKVAESGQGEWSDWRGRLVLELPERTGVYQLTLRCTLDGDSDEELRWPVYITLGEPLVPFSPPAPAWLARAACWGAGFGAEADEDAVLAALHQGLYRYGGRHWRYGYASREELDGEERYVFPLRETDAGRTGIQYALDDDSYEMHCYGDPAICKCPWQALADPESLCNFSDCYVFSDVLHAMAGTLGIGGLVPAKIRGTGHRGFLTREGRSLDPQLPGLVALDPDDESEDAYKTGLYYFGSHSLRLRSGTYYDATFGQTYVDPEEPIDVNRTGGSYADGITLADGSKELVSRGQAYGLWTHFELRQPSAEEGGPSESESTSDEDHGTPTARFTGNAVFDDESEGDEPIHRLRVEIEVELTASGAAAGPYSVQATLDKPTLEGATPEEHSEPVARRPNWTLARPSGTLLKGEAGKQTVQVEFSGEEIYRSKLDGPYRVHATLERGGEVIDTLELDTDPYLHRDFGELAGALHGLGLHPTEDGGWQARVEVEARKVEDFALELRWSENGQTLVYGGWTDELFTGHHAIEIRLPVDDDVSAGGSPSPEGRITAVLYDRRRTAIDALEVGVGEAANQP